MLAPSEEAGALGALGTQRAAPRPKSPRGAELPRQPFWGGPRRSNSPLATGTRQTFPLLSFLGSSRVPCLGPPLASLGAEAFRGPGFGATGAWQSQAAQGRGRVGGGGAQAAISGCPTRPSPGFLSDLLSSSLGSSRGGKTGPGARCPGARTGPTASRWPHRQSPPPHHHTHTDTQEPSPSCSFALLSRRVQAPPWERNHFRLMAVWLHECQLNPYPAPPFTPPAQTLGLSTF